LDTARGLRKIKRGNLSSCIRMGGDWINNVETKWSFEGLLAGGLDNRLFLASPSLFLRRSMKRFFRIWREGSIISNWRRKRELIHMLRLEKEMRNDS